MPPFATVRVVTEGKCVQPSDSTILQSPEYPLFSIEFDNEEGHSGNISNSTHSELGQVEYEIKMTNERMDYLKKRKAEMIEGASISRNNEVVGEVTLPQKNPMKEKL